MSANIEQSFIIRATVANDTKKGAKAVVDDARQLKLDLQKEMSASTSAGALLGGGAPSASGGPGGSGGLAASLLRGASSAIDSQQTQKQLSEMRKQQAEKQAAAERKRFSEQIRDEDQHLERIRKQVGAERLASIKNTAGEALKKRAYDQLYEDIVTGKTGGGGHGGGGKGGGGHGSRIFTDASTTGLDPLMRAGAGAVGDKLGLGVGLLAFAVVGKQIADATGKLREFTELYRSGQLDASGMAVAIGKSIPILGSFVEAGQNLREIMVGENHELEMQERYLQQINAAQDAAYRTGLQLVETRRQERETIRGIRREIEGIPLRGMDATTHGIESNRQAKKAQAEADKAAAKREAADNPELRKALDAWKAFNKAGGKGDELSEMMAGQIDPKIAAQMESHRRELEGERDRLLSALKRAKDNVAGTKAAKESGADERSKLADEEAEKARKEALKRDAEEQAQIAATTANRLTGIDAKVTESRLRRAGDVRAAELAAIDERVRSEQAAVGISAQAEKNATTDPARKAEIEARAERERAAIARRGAEDRLVAEKDFSLRSQQADFDASQAQIAAAEASQQERMRIAGQGGKAELLLVRSQAEAKKREIDQQLAQDLARDNTNAEEKRRRAKAEKDRIEAETKTATRRTIEQNRQDAASINMQLARVDISQLKNQANVGDVRAAAEARRAEIRAQFQQQRNELETVIHGEKTTPEARSRAAAQLAKVDQQQAMALALSGMTGGGGLPGMVQAGRTSGFAQNYQERQSPFIRLVNLQERLNANTELMVKVLQKIADAGGRGKPVFGNS